MRKSHLLIHVFTSLFLLLHIVPARSAIITISPDPLELSLGHLGSMTITLDETTEAGITINLSEAPIAVFYDENVLSDFELNFYLEYMTYSELSENRVNQTQAPIDSLFISGSTNTATFFVSHEGGIPGFALVTASADGWISGTAEVYATPVPAAVWLFGSGLIGLISLARRRTNV